MLERFFNRGLKFKVSKVLESYYSLGVILKEREINKVFIEKSFSIFKKQSDPNYNKIINQKVTPLLEKEKDFDNKTDNLIEEIKKSISKIEGINLEDKNIISSEFLLNLKKSKLTSSEVLAFREVLKFIIFKGVNGYKYIKREGIPGGYRYYYNIPEDNLNPKMTFNLKEKYFPIIEFDNGFILTNIESSKDITELLNCEGVSIDLINKKIFKGKIINLIQDMNEFRLIKENSEEVFSIFDIIEEELSEKELSIINNIYFELVNNKILEAPKIDYITDTLPEESHKKTLSRKPAEEDCTKIVKVLTYNLVKGEEEYLDLETHFAIEEIKRQYKLLNKIKTYLG